MGSINENKQPYMTTIKKRKNSTHVMSSTIPKSTKSIDYVLPESIFNKSKVWKVYNDQIIKTNYEKALEM